MKPIVTLFFLFLSITAFSQTSATRPYKLWNTIAYCSYDSFHPSHYVKADNNWEILYTLRTPMTLKQLDSVGVSFNNSQITLLRIGGLIENKDKKWQTTMPIFDEAQTEAIRKLSKVIAKESYAETKDDWMSFVKELTKRNLSDNAYSLVFSYVLDGKIWNQKLPSFTELQMNTTWSGAFWALYNKRAESSCGTNGYGDEFHQTWSDELSYWLDERTIERFIDEYHKNGKVEDKELLKKVKDWGLTDYKGNITIPIIDEKANDSLDIISDTIVSKLAENLHKYSSSFMKEYNLRNENVAKTILYHEVMWDIMDILTDNKLIIEPAILKGDEKASKQDFKKIVYIIK